jgi:lysophospholipase L1-like esterase
MNHIEENAIVGFDFVQPLVNFTDLFCDAEICDPKVRGKFMFEDDDHLSVDGSQFVAPLLTDAMAKALGG